MSLFIYFKKKVDYFWIKQKKIYIETSKHIKYDSNNNNNKNYWLI